ncbi:Protein PET117-like protein, mitochondrial [Trichoplax sp. H2]|nr:Protein PET117-like protein, mitochondrial [Trichoplax sp. H2]|eukprot:RDD37828.1 Protein PET117-like protein, mitochondrial [Trichoplax sp. H2]
MSARAKVVLGLSCLFSVGIVTGVYLSQKEDRKRLRVGVERDLERQRKKLQNKKELEEQLRLHEELLKKESSRLASNEN